MNALAQTQKLNRTKKEHKSGQMTSPSVLKYSASSHTNPTS
jgi:hypothetical protein